MILTCPECSAKYVVDPKALMPSGRMVRCAKCRHTWREMPPPEDTPVVSREEETRHLADQDPGESDPAAAETPRATPDQGRDQGHKDGPEEAPNKDSDKESGKGPERDPDLALLQRRKRPRPIPKGSNLPALQNHHYGQSKWGWVALAVFVTLIISSILLFHEPISESWPPARKLYQVIGLQPESSPQSPGVRRPAAAPKIPVSKRLVIENLRPVQEYEGDRPILIVRGEVKNITDDPQDIPPLRVALQDGKRVTIRQWLFRVSPGRVAAAGRVSFETRLPNPPTDARDLRISFTDE